MSFSDIIIETKKKLMGFKWKKKIEIYMGEVTS